MLYFYCKARQRHSFRERERPCFDGSALYCAIWLLFRQLFALNTIFFFFSIEILIECKENRAAIAINSANIDFVSWSFRHMRQIYRWCHLARIFNDRSYRDKSIYIASLSIYWCACRLRPTEMLKNSRNRGRKLKLTVKLLLSVCHTAHKTRLPFACC